MARKPADLRASGGEDAGAAWSLSPVAARETAANAVRVHNRARRALRSSLHALKTAAKRAGLPSSVGLPFSVGLHTLRHSAASVMLSAGVPLKVVSEVFGHASVAITGDIYGHVSPEVS